MRYALVVLFVFSFFASSAQKENIPATENFTIVGKVKKEITVA
jgi:hypothetical protein